MAKPTKEEQGFVYQLGQDMAKLGFEIEKLKNKSVKAIRIVVPAKPEKYQAYDIGAVINLPTECQHAICIKSQNGYISLIETGETLSTNAGFTTNEFYLAPIFRLEAETINAVLNQQQMSDIDAIQERVERDKLIYKYLAKWLTENWLQSVRERNVNQDLESQGVNVYVNKSGLVELLEVPFERNTTYSNYRINESTYADAKEAMLTEKARIDRGEVDLSVASDFNVVDYNYVLDMI